MRSGGGQRPRSKTGHLSFKIKVVSKVLTEGITPHPINFPPWPNMPPVRLMSGDVPGARGVPVERRCSLSRLALLAASGV